MAVPLLGNFFQSTDASTMTNAATSAVLASTAGFVVPAAGQYGIVRVDDVNAAGYNQITGPFEILTFTGNNTGTNTLSGFTRAQEGTSAHAFAAGSVWSQVFTKGALQPYEVKIADNTLTGLNTLLLPSTSIPAGIKGLTLRGKVQGNAATVDVAMQFNGDVGSNYAVTQLFATSSTPQSSAGTIGTGCLLAQAISGWPTSFVSDLPSPSDTAMTAKPVISHYSSVGAVGIRASFWNQGASAITSVLVYATGNCIAGSYVALFAWF